MQLTDFTQFTGSCFNGEPASCACACPFGLDVRSFAEKCEKGRWNAAWKALKTAVVFPEVVAALCPAPCRSYCQRAPLGGAIDVPGLEEAAIRYARKKADSFNVPPHEQTIAVVGAGACGLSAALNLALKKYVVTVFDRLPGWGGSLREDPRFPAFEEDFKLQFSAVKQGFCSFVYNHEATEAELASFDAVYFATGEGGYRLEGDKYFAGGPCAGWSFMEGIAMGPEASKVIEAYLMTGRPEPILPHEHAAHCERFVSHHGVESAEPVNTDTEEGAMAEAARCMKCDCTDCIDACIMLQQYRKKPHGLAREAYADSAAAPPIATQSLVRQTYSCLNCGRCGAVCPTNANLGAMFMLSRSDRFRRNTGPKAFHDFWLREMDFTTGEASAALAPKGKTGCAYLFFPGCRLGMSAPELVKKSYHFLQEATGGNTGLFLGCCGVPALWAGDLERLQKNTDRIRADWEALGKPTLVFACATCERTLREYLPEIPLKSLYAIMAEAGLQPMTSGLKKAAVFDPCAAREDSELRGNVRELAARGGTELAEIEGGSRCCGFGGHIQVPNPELFGRFSEEAANASDAPYVVYCINCREVFLSRGKECRHILETYFGEEDAHTPSILEKRRNALRLKQELMKEDWDMEFNPAASPWDALKLEIPGELQEKMDKTLVSTADLQETIWYAETGGDKLAGDEGWFLASLVKSVITYWVQYRPAAEGDENTFEVGAVYSHRMKWRGAETT